MILPKLISSKVVKEKFYSSTGIQNEISDDDFRLWIAECYLILGLPAMFKKKIIGHKQDPRYDYKHYKVPLPCDFYKLVPSGISLDGHSVRWSENSFHYLMDGDCCGLDELNSGGTEIFIDQFKTEFSPQALKPGHLDSIYEDVTFDIYDNEITFSKKEGKVCLAYWAYMLDDESYLMVPDDAKLLRALTDYVIWKNDYILWRQQTISDKMYQESRDNKNWSLSSAANNIKLPDIDQLEVLKNSVIRLLPLANSYTHFFRNLGTPEVRRMN